LLKANYSHHLKMKKNTGKSTSFTKLRRQAEERLLEKVGNKGRTLVYNLFLIL